MESLFWSVDNEIMVKAGADMNRQNDLETVKIKSDQLVYQVRFYLSWPLVINKYLARIGIRLHTSNLSS